MTQMRLQRLMAEVDDEEEGVRVIIQDEGYQSALDCTACKKMEESYKQQIAALQLKLTGQQNLIDKYYYIKNELTNDEENFLKAKGKVEKGVKKGYDLKGLALKEQYLSKIKRDEKRHFRFLRLDNKAQLRICKIDALRGLSGGDDSFIDELLETFEENSMQLQRLKTAVEERKEQQAEYVKSIDEFMYLKQKSVEEMTM